MKKIILLLSLLFAVKMSHAQTASSYMFKALLSPYSSIAATGTALPAMIGDDATATTIPIGFTFTYCGTAYNQVAACSNGYLVLGGVCASNSYDNSLAKPCGGAGLLMPYWDDLYGSYPGCATTSSAYYSTAGFAPYRVFTIEWKDFNAFPWTNVNQCGRMNMQVKLYETYNTIEFCYGGVLSSYKMSATIGIANSATDYLVLPNHLDTLVPSSTFYADSIDTTPLPNQVFRWSPCNTLSPITGGLTVCLPDSTILTDTTTGGTWSSFFPTIATVNPATGTVYGISAGVDSVAYTINFTGCADTVAVNIVPIPLAGSISGLTNVCVSSSIGLIDPVFGGTWAVSNNNATIAGGLVTGVAVGIDTIYYIFTNICGSDTTSFIDTIGLLPNAGSIGSIASVCAGSAITLIDSVPGGTWLATNSNASIFAPGIIEGITPGVDTLFYEVSNACGTASTSYIITINPVPVIAPITGPTDICVGTISNFSNITSGGTWFSSNPAIATISLVTGSVTGLSAGSTTITYMVINALGCASNVTVLDTISSLISLPSITGPNSECVFATTLLSDAAIATTGIWLSSDSTIATVSGIIGSANVTGVAAGIAIISYTVTNICGISTLTIPDTVFALPPFASFTIPANICVGATDTLLATPAGGNWFSTDTTLLTVVPITNIATAVGAGIATIGYTLTNARGCSSSTFTDITVNPIPVVAPIFGTTNQCIGTINTFMDATPTGIWSTSNTAIATIDAFGNVTDVGNGIANISYTVSNGWGCSTTVSIPDTVFSLPAHTAITGSLNVCTGKTTTLANSMPSGTWSSLNTSITAIDPVLGIATGLSPGTASVIYTVGNSCGTINDSAVITVNALPFVPPIAGPSTTVCDSSAVILSDSISGGVWSVANPAIATINIANGFMYGYTAGTETVTYTYTDAHGCINNNTLNITFSSAISATLSPAGTATLCNDVNVNLNVFSTATGLSYQWLQNGMAIAGAVSNNYVATTPGDYAVNVTNGTCTEFLGTTTVQAPPTPAVNLTAPNILYTTSYATYQWYLNDTIIPGATSSIYFAPVSGSYTVKVTDGTGCPGTSSAFSFISMASSVPAISGQNNITIYPNPATDILNITSNQPVNLSIFRPDGKLLQSSTQTNSIDISQLTNGVYIIMIYNKEQILLQAGKFTKL